jgi:hypothetical protein
MCAPRFLPESTGRRLRDDADSHDDIGTNTSRQKRTRVGECRNCVYGVCIGLCLNCVSDGFDRKQQQRRYLSENATAHTTIEDQQ